MASPSRTSCLSSSPTNNPSAYPPTAPTFISVHSAAYASVFSAIPTSSGMGRASPSPSLPPPSKSHSSLSVLPLPLSSSLPSASVPHLGDSTASASDVAEKDKVVGRRAGKRPAWSAEEDKTLLKFVRCHGPRRFNLLRERGLLSRDGKSCRQRWTAWLRPDRPNQRKSRGRIDLTAEEEMRLRSLQAIMGNKWAQMAPHFPRHTAHEIKNLWHGRVKKKLESEKNEKNKQESGNVDARSDCSMEESVKCGEKFSGEEGKTTKEDGSTGGGWKAGDEGRQFSGNSGGNVGENVCGKSNNSGSFSNTSFSVDNSSGGMNKAFGCVKNEMPGTTIPNAVKREDGDFMMGGHSLQSGSMSYSQKLKSPKVKGLDNVVGDSHLGPKEGPQIVPQLAPTFSENEIDNLYSNLSSQNYNSMFSNFSSLEDLDRLAAQIKSQMQSFQENFDTCPTHDFNDNMDVEKKGSEAQFNEDQITQNQLENIMTLISCGETPQILSRSSTATSVTCTTLENPHHLEFESMADVSSFSSFDMESMALESFKQPSENFSTMESYFSSWQEDCMQKVDFISSYPSQTFFQAPSAIPSSYLPSHLVHNSQKTQFLKSQNPDNFSPTISPSASPSLSPVEPSLSLPPLTSLTPSNSFSSLASFTSLPPSNYLPADDPKPAGQDSSSTFSTDDIFERLKRLQEAAGIPCSVSTIVSPQPPPTLPPKIAPLNAEKILPPNQISKQISNKIPHHITNQSTNQILNKVPNQKTWQNVSFTTQFSEHERMSPRFPAQIAPQLKAKQLAGNVLATGWRDCSSSGAGRKLPHSAAGKPANNLGLPGGNSTPGFQGMTSYVWRGTEEDWESVLNLWGEEASVVPVVEI